MADRLIVRGLGACDGEYEFDLANLVSVNGSEAFTLREQHRIKIATGYRGLEIREAVSVFDAAMMVQLVSVLLERNGKAPNVDRIWDSKFLYSSGDAEVDLSEHGKRVVLFHMDDRLGDDDESVQDGEEGEGGDGEGPPA